MIIVKEIDIYLAYFYIYNSKNTHKGFNDWLAEYGGEIVTDENDDLFVEFEDEDYTFLKLKYGL